MGSPRPLPRTGFWGWLARWLWPFRREGAALGPEGEQPPDEREAQRRAQEVLQETLTKVEAVLEQAEDHVRQLLRLEERVRGAGEEPASVPRSWAATDNSAALLLQYVRHFFDLIAMENRVFEQRLAALQHAFEKMEGRLEEHTSSVSTRLTALEGVQLPLLGAPTGTPPRERPEPAVVPLVRWPPAPGPAVSPPAAAPVRAPPPQGARGEERGALHVWPTRYLWPTRPDDAGDRTGRGGRETETFSVVIRGLSNFDELAAARDVLADLRAVSAAEVERYGDGTAVLRLSVAGPLAAEVALEALRAPLGPGLSLRSLDREAGTLTLQVS